ncbi:hypothetical protein NSK_000431 [Nannochloropsis salina CCMP1776]|uniref:Golgi apparatus membrane protein TVP23 homolog n=1 Tax=Nannochloropsis salina CCMP1776 TaxID=1027361 RepID=A0A4D9DCE4_9STRA|nr:hypothetical protein NSK_000431 [Nannochloropsis salina CCMP1776]|eukprot:TFJ88077.1 hypothetical protein NSK_000431 [Nannochloropsis salina CCMP1776]
MMEGHAQGDDELQFIRVPETSVSSQASGQTPYAPMGAAPASGPPPPPAGDALAFIKQSRHPVAAAFHFVFKALAIFFYLFGGFFSSNFVFICVVCILLLAFDFWTVKNVTGRLLVGLRWWNNVRDDGSNEWVFESVENPGEIHPADARLFWTGLYVTPIVWSVFFLVALLKFSVQWLVIVFVALVLSGANIVGYYKCSNDQKKKVQNVVQGAAFKTAFGLGTSAVQSFISSTFGQQQQGGGNAEGPHGPPSHV